MIVTDWWLDPRLDSDQRPTFMVLPLGIVEACILNGLRKGGCPVEFNESDGIIELTTPMPVGRRVVLVLLALFPLLAPYELLFRAGWSGRWHIAFLFPALISLGALGLSVLLVYAALAGLEVRMRFDLARRVMMYQATAPLVRLRAVEVPFDAIVRVEVIPHEWSDGPDSFSIRVVKSDGRRFESGSTECRPDSERNAERIRDVVGLRFEAGRN